MDTAIGNVSYFIILSVDGIGENYETTLNKKFYANTEATYGQVNTAMTALLSLSTNNYSDTTCVTNISTNEMIAG